MPFIDELLGGINSIICDLQPQQVQTFYEAVGHMISARWELNSCLGHRIFWSAQAFAWGLRRNVFIVIILPSTDQQQQEALIEKYMQLPNAVWDDIINQVAFSKLILFYFDLILFSKLLLFFFDKRILFWWFFIPGEQERWRFERPRGSKTVGKHSQGIDF